MLGFTGECSGALVSGEDERGSFGRVALKARELRPLARLPVPRKTTDRGAGPAVTFLASVLCGEREVSAASPCCFKSKTRLPSSAGYSQD